MRRIYRKYCKTMKKIGEDNTGLIYKIEDKYNNIFYAIKEIYIGDSENFELVERYQKMLNTLMKIKTENIIKYYDYFLENDYLIIVMEYVDTTLKQFIDKHGDENMLIKEELINDIILQICNCLKEIHDNGIIYRNLTPKHISIDNNNKIKIFGFDINKDELDDDDLNLTRDPNPYENKYLAPEIIMQEKYNYKADIFSLGCIIYELFTLNNYYISRIHDEICEINTDYYNPKWEEVIDLTLNLDYKKRPSIEEILSFVQSIKDETKGDNNLKDKIDFGVRIGKKYKIIKNIGDGGYGKVFLVKYLKDVYALKKLKFILSEEEIKQYQNILNILFKIKNKNIIEYYDYFLENDYFNIVMEYGGDKNLKQLIKKYRENSQLIEEELIKDIIIQICAGLKEIHNNGIIHRDLTPDNIFIDINDNIKIGDFGISKIFIKNTLFSKNKQGKYHYFAPEFELEGKYNEKTDIYSLGCVIYELLTLNEYYIDKKIEEKDCKINAEIYNPKWQELIDLLLNKNYKLRPNIDEVIDIINKIELFDKENKENKNKLKLYLRVDEIDINNEVNFLTPFTNIENFQPLKELDETNTEIYISGKKVKFQRYFIPEKEGIYSIIIYFNYPMNDCSFMFYGCDNILTIDLSSFNSQNITNLKSMFMFCTKLREVDLSFFNTKNVINMDYLFCRCKNISYLDLTSFETNKIKNIIGFVDGCNSLKKIRVKKNSFNQFKDKRLSFI